MAIENIFKHGIDKSCKQNQITIPLRQSYGYLNFSTMNRKVNGISTHHPHGFGIANLTQRLKMLYGSNFELRTDQEKELYTAFLKILSDEFKLFNYR